MIELRLSVHLSLLLVMFDQGEQVTDGSVLLNRMSQWLLPQDPVLVLTANTLPFNEALLLKILNDPLDCTFSNSNVGCYLT